MEMYVFLNKNFSKWKYMSSVNKGLIDSQLFHINRLREKCIVFIKTTVVIGKLDRRGPIQTYKVVLISD